FAGRVQDQEPLVMLGQVPGRGQAGLAAADHDDIHQVAAGLAGACRLLVARVHRVAPWARATVKLNIWLLCAEGAGCTWLHASTITRAGPCSRRQNGRSCCSGRRVLREWSW